MRTRQGHLQQLLPQVGAGVVLLCRLTRTQQSEGFGLQCLRVTVVGSSTAVCACDTTACLGNTISICTAVKQCSMGLGMVVDRVGYVCDGRERGCTQQVISRCSMFEEGHLPP